MEILHGNRVGLEPRRTKHGHKSHILFCGIAILCRLPSLWCPLTHLSITKLTVSYQTCSEWFHLPQWKLAMGTVAGWSHPGPKSREVSWPTGRPTLLIIPGTYPYGVSLLSFILMGWVSWPIYIFVFLASFLALWWPNIWLKMEFPNFFEKTIGSIHFIPGIYPYGVSLLTPIHFRVPSLIFGPLVAKYLDENGVSGII